MVKAALLAVLPERWRVAAVIDQAARAQGWHVRFRTVTADAVIVVYKKGPAPEPGRGQEDPA